jgi:Flp pilus assembly protein TadB
MVTLLSAVAAAAAAWVYVPSRTQARHRLLGVRGGRGRRVSPALLSSGVALAVFFVVGGLIGLLGAVAAALVAHRYLQRASAAAASDAAARRALELPVALDVLAAGLAVGATQQAALDAVARGMGGSLRDDFACVAGAMRVGADAAEAWSLVDAADVQALGAVLSRAQITGAPASALIAVLADQYRQRARTVALDAARALGVRATGPLGLCFLPAFVLVAVVPLVASLVPWVA